MEVVMCKKLRFLLLLAALGLVLVACATRGPIVPQPPSVSVTRFNSYSISPQLVKFEAQIVIRNRMPLDLDFARVDYAVDLFEKQLFSDTFDGLKRTRGNGTQTVTFPFQIAMEDIANSAAELVAEGSLRVTFRGEVYPAGDFAFAAIPFSKTIELPIPQIPIVAFQRVESLPLGNQVRISLLVRNTNSFPISIESIDSYLEINDDQFRLLHTEQSTEIPSGSARTVVLEMHNTPGKTLGIVLSLLQSPTRQFTVVGNVECGSPYGRIYIPLKLEHNP
jgi:LEA14-like dessication related protein